MTVSESSFNHFGFTITPGVNFLEAGEDSDQELIETAVKLREVWCKEDHQIEIYTEITEPTDSFSWKAVRYPLSTTFEALRTVWNYTFGYETYLTSYERGSLAKTYRERFSHTNAATTVSHREAQGSNASFSNSIIEGEHSVAIIFNDGVTTTDRLETMILPKKNEGYFGEDLSSAKDALSLARKIVSVVNSYETRLFISFSTKKESTWSLWIWSSPSCAQTLLMKIKVLSQEIIGITPADEREHQLLCEHWKKKLE
ncbi:MAG: hypothetical protein H7A37_04095 [Chlamydiales bacterium]|nr:hypothetical protein [Chlamydiia bacterium]MCP5507467.1 hypothetical protein [Chlamydiales bacterium]